MSKSFRWCKNFCKMYGMRGKLTFADYKESLHSEQKLEKRERKNFLKAKSMLMQGRKCVSIGNTIYYLEEDKKSVVALVLNLDGIRRAIDMIKTKENEYELKRQDGFANSCY